MVLKNAYHRIIFTKRNNLHYGEYLTSYFPSGQTVLRNLCGTFQAGHITAIIGPSGAGKTSLLSLLRGQTYYATIGGVIRVR